MRRRRLLAAAALAAAGGPVGAFGTQTAARPCDVVVVGAGGAGLAAAVSALEAGARDVLVLEKMRFAGGHTLASAGSLNALADGWGDSAERFMRDTWEAGGRAADPALVEKLVIGSRELLPWMQGMGVRFESSPFEAYNGGWRRAWRTVNSQPGLRYVEALMRRLRSLGGRVRYGARAQALVTVQERCCGVRLWDGEVIEAGAVVLAAGGWGADAQLRRRWSPMLTEVYRTTY